MLLPRSTVSIAAISVRLGGRDGQGDGLAVNGAIAAVAGQPAASAGGNPNLFPTAVATARQERLAAAAQPAQSAGPKLVPEALHAKADPGGRHYFHAMGLVRMKEEENDMEREYEGDFVHTLATSIGLGLGIGIVAVLAVRFKRSFSAGMAKLDEEDHDEELDDASGDDEWGQGAQQQAAVFGSRAARMYADRREDVEHEQHQSLTSGDSRSVRRRSSGGCAFDI